MPRFSFSFRTIVAKTNAGKSRHAIGILCILLLFLSLSSTTAHFLLTPYETAAAQPSHHSRPHILIICYRIRWTFETIERSVEPKWFFPALLISCSAAWQRYSFICAAGRQAWNQEDTNQKERDFLKFKGRATSHTQGEPSAASFTLVLVMLSCSCGVLPS
jgi:hypothetical protein